MGMETIMIVDPFSTGGNYLTDIAQRGFRPVGLWSKRNELIFAAMEEERDAIEHRFRNQAEFLVEGETYAETLQMVKAYKPKFIIAGGEIGVELAENLADDLGLPGNSRKQIPLLTNKYKVNQELKKQGIRSIRGTLIHNWEEALAYYREQGLKGCVLKPYRGAGSYGVRICENEAGLKAAFDEVFAVANCMDGEEAGMLLQEKIEGTEYVVNTISCNGFHKFSSLWRYTKKTVAGGGRVYSFVEFLDRLEAGCSSLITYTFAVLEALGVKNGIVHTELMLDENGPVLIEVNCRVMGNSMPAGYLDQLLGHHETDMLLDAYLHPKRFAAHIKDPYRPLAKGLMKNLIAGRDTQVVFAPILSLLKQQKSFYGGRLHKALSPQLKRTVDLDTCSGVIYLVNEDDGQLYRDKDFLDRVESNYFSMLFTENSVRREDMPNNLASIPAVISQLNLLGATILLSNEIEQLAGVTCVSEEQLEAASGGYTYGIFDLNYRENEDYETLYSLFFQLASKVRAGGWLVVPKRSYWHLSCGRESVEILCEAAGFRIEVPTLEASDTMLIRKEKS